MATDRISVTRRVAAPADRIFRIVSSPAGHAAIDGSGMLLETTDVTNYCDWSGIGDTARAAREWPIVPIAMLERSVDNLARIAAQV